VSRKDPKLAEFGLPATSPEYRRQGIGQALFNAPVEDFTDMGGEAIFLGSSSYAFRTYNRAGYRKLVGSPALVYVTSGASPEEYLVDFFRDIGSCSVSSGKYSDNIPAVPLVHTPHDWQILDANVNLLSLRYSQYAGFAGQAGRFIKLLDTKDSTFFASRAGDREKVVGLSTAVLKPDTNTCNVDGFTHQYYIENWNQLIDLALEWGEEQGASRFTATVSNEDYKKIDMFKAMGFIEAGKGEVVLLDSMQIVNFENGKEVESILLELV
jgi:GNAT superfamily N-acetyltransferase